MHEMPMTELLGIFPSLAAVGGVQASAREAWQAIVSRIGESHASFLGYTPGESKARAALAAVAHQSTADILLVWHIHLLKLAPLVAAPAARVFLFLHGIEAWRPQDTITRWALGKVHQFLTNSDYTWARFTACNPRFSHVPHLTVRLGAGAPLETPPPPPAAKPVALMLGRMARGEDYKGHRQVIEAWPQVLAAAPDAQLWIAGDGGLRPDLEQFAQARGLASSVRFWGQISENQKEQLIQQSRCLVLPSRGEGFGIVYLEAMRHGRPCLVSDRDAGREVIHPPEAGLAVNPDAPHEIADAVTRLLGPGDEWYQWSQQARRRYETQFTAQHFRDRLNAALFAA